MCFEKSKVQLKAAEEDIKVFKIVRRLNNGNYFSFYQDFEYSKGEVYHETVEINEEEVTESVNHAFHSYMPDMVDIVIAHCCFVKGKYLQIVPKNNTLLLDFFLLIIITRL